MIQRKSDPPRGVLKTAGSASQFRHERYHPSPDLDAYVEHYWSSSGTFGDSRPTVRRRCRIRAST
jgi:hypothetical protein